MQFQFAVKYIQINKQISRLFYNTLFIRNTTNCDNVMYVNAIKCFKGM